MQLQSASDDLLAFSLLRVKPRNQLPLKPQELNVGMPAHALPLPQVCLQCGAIANT